jgi:hypothetical protein
MPTKRIARLFLLLGIGAWGAVSLIKLSARRHLAEDQAGSVGAKFGATVGGI